MPEEIPESKKIREIKVLSLALRKAFFTFLSFKKYIIKKKDFRSTIAIL